MFNINPVTLGILGAIALFVFWAIGMYNRFVREKAMVSESWSGVDVQLKRRYDLVPNLVAVVKQYSIHEKDVLEKVTQMRAVSMGAASVDQKADAEKGLTSALKTLFAVAENYPDLKANQNFLDLQQQLFGLEGDIQLARRYYNGSARNYNIAVQSFPGTVIARMFGFNPVSYFEIAADEAQNPKITF
jgi:LemA protein